MTDKERLDLMMSTNLAGIVKDDFLKWLGENGFFNAPASTKYHGNYAGGLFDHYGDEPACGAFGGERSQVETPRESVHRGYVPRPLQNRPVSRNLL